MAQTLIILFNKKTLLIMAKISDRSKNKFKHIRNKFVLNLNQLTRVSEIHMDSILTNFYPS